MDILQKFCTSRICASNCNLSGLNKMPLKTFLGPSVVLSLIIDGTWSASFPGDTLFNMWVNSVLFWVEHDIGGQQEGRGQEEGKWEVRWWKKRQKKRKKVNFWNTWKDLTANTFFTWKFWIQFSFSSTHSDIIFSDIIKWLSRLRNRTWVSLKERNCFLAKLKFVRARISLGRS